MSKYVSATGEMKLLARRNEFLFDVEIWLLNDAVNRNGWQYTDLPNHMSSFEGTPILVAYTNDGKQVGDGHNFELVADPETGEIVPTFTGANAERIVGALSDEMRDFRMEQKDGNMWIVGKGTLWRWYSRELVDKIETDARQGRSMSISIETLVTKFHIENDVEIEDEYQILGTTILGDHVEPAVRGAKIVALQELEDRFNGLKLRAASYLKQETEPQPKQKGVNSNMKHFSRKQLASLAPRFEGYTVLAAAQDDNGIFVCLMAADGAACTYTMQSVDETIMPERITKVNAEVNFPFGDDVKVACDSAAMTDEIAAHLASANNELASVKDEMATVKAQMSAMEQREKTRRVSAAKEKATATLANFNECCDSNELVDEAEIEPIINEIECGAFTECVNAEGAWIGDSIVEEKVLAACAKKVQEAQRAAREAAKSIHIWDKGFSDSNQRDNSVEALLARKGIN